MAITKLNADCVKVTTEMSQNFTKKQLEFRREDLQKQLKEVDDMLALLK